MNLPLKLETAGDPAPVWRVRKADEEGRGHVDVEHAHEEDARSLVASLLEGDRIRAEQAKRLGQKPPAKRRWAMYDPAGKRVSFYLGI